MYKKAFLGLWLPLVTNCATLKETKQSGVIVKTDSKTCYHLTPENNLNEVKVCNDLKNFEFQIANRVMRYDLSRYREGIKSFLIRYVASTHYSMEGLLVADIELWLSSHWQNPNKTEVVAVVKGPAGSFSFHVPIEPDFWLVPSQVSWLGNGIYPSLEAKKLGFLEIKAKPGFSEATLKDFMAETGIFAARGKNQKPLVKKVFGYWPHLILGVEPFAESKVARHIKAHIHAPLFIENLSMPQDSEQDGAKAKFYQFRF